MERDSFEEDLGKEATGSKSAWMREELFSLCLIHDDFRVSVDYRAQAVGSSTV